jgi:hypothetical protein
VTLLDAVVRVNRKMRPTPTAGDAKASGSRNLEGSKAHAGVSLTDAVLYGGSTSARAKAPPMWPTPTASPYGSRNNGDPHDGRTEYATKGAPSLDTMARVEGGILNAAWVEALMGFPPGWVTATGQTALPF